MSIQAMVWAKQQRTGDIGRKCVLLCLANYADETGYCYPSQETIAEEVEASVRTVREYVKVLEMMGFIARARRASVGGHRLPDAYQLRLPAELAGGSVAYRQNTDKPTGKPLPVNRKSKSKRERITTQEASAFEQAWRAYPRRAGGNSRQAAEKAWNARVAQGHSAKDMLDGVYRYALYCELTDRVGTEFVKMASSFFGPGLHFNESWDIPASGQKRYSSAKPQDEEESYIGTVI